MCGNDNISNAGINNDKSIVLGIDIGGTTCKCGVFSVSGELLYKDEIPTRKDEGGSLILEDIKKHIPDMLEAVEKASDDIAGVGIGVPGAVRDDGTVNKCVNLGWGVFNVAQTFSKMTGYKVKVGNDEEKEYCNCGKRGCLEQVASATGIVKTAVRMLSESDEPSALRDIPYISAKAVFDEAKNGDSVALKVVDYMCRYLGKGLACASGMVDTEVICIGGGVSAAGGFLLSRVEKYYKEYVFHASRNTKILKATLGNDAGMYGAARLVLNE